MLRGSLIEAFRSSSKASNVTPPPSTGTPTPSISSSSVFPALRRLETSADSAPSTPRFSVQAGSSRFVASNAAGLSSSSSSSSGKASALITLKFTGPSFLDVVVKDAETKQALYILETVYDCTYIYRLDSDTRQAIKTAAIKFPPTVLKGRGKTGISVQVGEGRWREAEELLKCGALGNFANRKFNIPHWPNPLKWKLVPGSSYYCTSSGLKGPIAVFDAAVLSAPPRLRVFQTFLNGDAERTQENYRGVPVMLLDYLILTSLLMVTDVQEWLDRPQTENGRVRIPGSSAPVVQKWLAIIHGEPIPDSPPASPTLAGSAWDARSRTSAGYGQSAYAQSAYGGSSSSDPMTPMTPAMSIRSTFFTRRDEDVPPVPPLPDSMTRARPYTLSSASHIYSSTGKGSLSASSFSPLTPPPPLTPPSAVSSVSSSAASSTPGSPAVSRPLPRPPTAGSGSAPLRRPRTSDGGMMSLTSTSAAASAYSRAAATSSSLSLERPGSPSMMSVGSSSTSGSRRSRLGRSLTVANVPPQQPPPSSALPLPPKLAQELSGSMYNASGSSASAERADRRISTPLPQRPPGIYEETVAEAPGPEELAQRVQAMALSPDPGPYPTYNAPGPITDAGMIHIADAAGGVRRSYAETIYEQPPPAYDAIDFSLPHVPLPPHTGVPQ